jgi:hypothetical protein
MKIRISPDPTPQMIEAGIKKLAKIKGAVKLEKYVKEMFKAMVAARPTAGRPVGSKNRPKDELQSMDGRATYWRAL